MNRENRLSRLERAGGREDVQVIGVMWGDEEGVVTFVQPDALRGNTMSLETFRNLFPGGTCISVVYEDVVDAGMK